MRAACAAATGAPSPATRRARSRPSSATRGRASSSAWARASTRSTPGDHVVLSWLPYCGRCPHCTSGRLTLCDVAAPALLAGTLLDGTTRLSLDGRPVHHYSFLSTFADRTVVPEASCVRIRRDAPLRVAALVGCAIATGFGAVVNRARLAPGILARRVRRRRRRAVGCAGRRPLGSRHRSSPSTRAGAASPGARAWRRARGRPRRRRSRGGRAGADGRTGRRLRRRVVRRARRGHRCVQRSIRRGGTLVCVGLPPAGAIGRVPRPRARARREDGHGLPLRLLPAAHRHADADRPAHGRAGSSSTG